MPGDISVSRVSFWNRFLNVASFGGRTGGAAACGRALEWGLDKPRKADGGPGDAQIPDAVPDALPDAVQSDVLQTDVIQSDVIEGDVFPNDAQDDALQADAIQTDAQLDGPICVPTTITETAFLLGTFTTIDNKSMQLSSNDSSIFLYRDWTGEWRAANGLPTVATPPWTPGGSGTHPSATVQDPISLEAAINFDTYTGNTDKDLYYSIGPAFSNSLGWAVQWRVRLQQSDNVGSECSLDVIDSTWQGRVGLTGSQVVEVTTAKNYSFDPTTKMNTYRFEARGNNYRVYVNENLQIFGTFNTSNTASPSIKFGDLYLTQDGNSYWNSVSWYVGGDHVPYKTSGQYISQVYDLTSANNNIGDTAFLSVTANVPVGTTLSFETRTGGTSLPDASWSNWQAVTEPSKIINSPANRYIQIKAILQTADTAQTPIVNDITINYCVR